MSLSKSIASKKEHRKPYLGSKRWARSCRNHGSCSYCQSNRLIAVLRAELGAKASLTD